MNRSTSAFSRTALRCHGAAAPSKITRRTAAPQYDADIVAVGGRTSSIERDGFVVNRAAAALPSRTDIARLRADSGPGTPFEPLAVSVGMPRDGQLCFPVRRSGLGGALDLAGTDLFSLRSKLLTPRLSMDPMRRRRRLANGKTYFFSLGLVGHRGNDCSKKALERPGDELLPEMIRQIETVIPGLSAEGSRSAASWTRMTSSRSANLGERLRSLYGPPAKQPPDVCFSGSFNR